MTTRHDSTRVYSRSLAPRRDGASRFSRRVMATAVAASCALTPVATQLPAATAATSAATNAAAQTPTYTAPTKPANNSTVSKAQKRPANVSPDGPPLALPLDNGNPHNLKVGDTVTLSNFRRSDFPICFVALSCLFKPNYEATITEVRETSQGTRIRINAFGGYAGHPIYHNGVLVGVTQGSNGGMGYGYLFPDTASAKAAQPKYKGIRLGPFGLWRAQPGQQPSGSALPALSSSRGGSGTAKAATAAAASTSADAKREQAFAQANTAGWTKQGTRHIAQVKWNPGTQTVYVDPVGDTGASLLTGMSAVLGSSGTSAGDMDTEAAWRELVALGVPNSMSMKQQFVCHAQGSAIRKGNWKLELGRSAAASQAEQARNACNMPKV